MGMARPHRQHDRYGGVCRGGDRASSPHTAVAEIRIRVVGHRKGFRNGTSFQRETILEMAGEIVHTRSTT